MSPNVTRLSRGLAAAAAVWLALSGPAPAVVGGADGEGTLGRSAVMVLSSRGGMCSGVVVAPDAVLTAAHCIAGAADTRIHFRDGAGEPVLIAPAAASSHPGYDAGAIAGRRRSIDLALLRAPSPLPSRFAVASLSSTGAGGGSALTLGGYGVSREGEMRTTGTFRAAALTVAEPYGPSRILVWAAPPPGRPAGACQGDSGGPIADGSGAVLAVATWAAGGPGGCGRMSQGVLLGPQRAWIDRVLAGWGRAAVWR